MKGRIIVFVMVLLVGGLRSSGSDVRWRYIDCEFMWPEQEPWGVTFDLEYGLQVDFLKGEGAITSPVWEWSSYKPTGWYSGELIVPEQIDFGIYEPNGKVFKITGVYRFYRNGVTRLVLPGNNAKIECGIESCYHLNEIVFPDGVEEISGILSDCPELVEVKLPDCLKSIPEKYFMNTDLREVVLPSSLTSVGNYSFSYNPHLSSLDLCNLREAGEYSFRNLHGLTEVVLPESLESIGAHSFSYMWSLRKLELPSNQVDMGDGCFAGCPNLEEVKIMAGVPYECPEFVMEYASRLTLLVPDGSLEAYRTAPGWNEVRDIREGGFSPVAVSHISEPRSWNVTGDRDRLVVTGAMGEQLWVSDSCGTIFAILKGSAEYEIVVPRGIYIVNNGIDTVKVMVR